MGLGLLATRTAHIAAGSRKAAPGAALELLFEAGEAL